MESQLMVAVSEDGADVTRLDTLTRQIRDEILRLDVIDVQQISSGPLPDGARGVDATTVGGLLVGLMGTGGLSGVITALRAWVSRGHTVPRRVRLEMDGDVLELSDSTQSERDDLVKAFIERHRDRDTGT